MIFWNEIHVNRRRDILFCGGINPAIANFAWEQIPPEFQDVIEKYIRWKEKDLVIGDFS